MDMSAPWHRASFDLFIHERLPQLLASRLPLSGYRVTVRSETSCRIDLTLGTSGQETAPSFEDLPRPDAEGVFWRNEKPYVVLPIASCDDLDRAEIRCVGEQLLDDIAARLGEAPDDMPWDETLARLWLPLDSWIHAALALTAQALDTTSALSRKTHLRRLSLPNREKMFTPGHYGRACPIETPEGPNIGRVLVVARGATIREGRLEIVDTRPEMTLGLCASLIPFLEHDEPCRALMGANMLRQWVTPSDPEPPLVGTGNEPEDPNFWSGHNLVTAYVPWGLDSFEDAIVLSETCAQRLATPKPIQVGDKLGNRHGAKGVVSRILPDAEMPHLPDGTCVDLVYDCMGLYSRLNFGQVREALMGRIAQREGVPAIVPPFAAPAEAELRERLSRVGLPEDGMEQLTEGKDGAPLERRATVGVVYWGRLIHTAAQGYFASTLPEGCQRQGELEYYALRNTGAITNLREHFHLCASEAADASTLAERVRSGAALTFPSPSPRCAELIRRLAAIGIGAEKGPEGLTFGFAAPVGEILTLAQPIPHPWLPERTLTEVGGSSAAAPQFRTLTEANARMSRLLNMGAPETLRAGALGELETAARRYLNALIPASQLRLLARPMFNGRAVATPGDLRYDQVGIPEEMAWTLFGPLLARELGEDALASPRTEATTEYLDALMARSWVLVQRAPVVEPTGFLAFHPVRCAGQVIRLHPLANHSLNADFDGDILSIYLPLTEEAQYEAGEKLSLAGHLHRDPGLLGNFLPLHSARAGLALLARTAEGCEEIRQLAGTPSPLPAVPLNRAGLLALAQEILSAQGAEATIAAMDHLARRGFQRAKRSGLSLSPFLGAGFARPNPPQSPNAELWKFYTPYSMSVVLVYPPANAELWEVYTEELIERLQAHGTDDDLEPFLTAVRSGSRSNYPILQKFVGAYGVVEDVEGNRVAVRHALRDGMTPEEFHTLCVGARNGIARAAAELEHISRTLRQSNLPTGYGIVARAMRARHPGLVFARAAAANQTDPLTDLDSRLFVA
jgi:hypothetical protein